MNNPYLSLDKFFNKENSYQQFQKQNQDDIYFNYITKESELKKQFTPASRYNSDNITDKIGNEYKHNYNMIPYSLIDKGYNDYRNWHRRKNAVDERNKEIKRNNVQEKYIETDIQKEYKKYIAEKNSSNMCNQCTFNMRKNNSVSNIGAFKCANPTIMSFKHVAENNLIQVNPCKIIFILMHIT